MGTQYHWEGGMIHSIIYRVSDAAGGTWAGGREIPACPLLCRKL